MEYNRYAVYFILTLSGNGISAYQKRKQRLREVKSLAWWPTATNSGRQHPKPGLVPSYPRRDPLSTLVLAVCCSDSHAGKHRPAAQGLKKKDSRKSRWQGCLIMWYPEFRGVTLHCWRVPGRSWRALAIFPKSSDERCVWRGFFWIPLKQGLRGLAHTRVCCQTSSLVGLPILFFSF